jgi:hypothetical protein
MRNIRASGRDVVLPPLAFLGQQVLIMTPWSLPFWLAGLLFYLVSREAKAYRAFGWAFLITIGFFLLAHGKNYYAAPAYPIVLAAGGVACELFLRTRRFESSAVGALRPSLEAACFLWLLLGIVPLLPVALPVLPVDAYLRYQKHLPFAVPRSEHGHMGAALPQHYADEFGWPEMAAAVARVYHSLPKEEQRKTAIFADNYGEAGAIDFFGAQYGLPKAICPHQNYFVWGPREYTGEIMILVGSASIDEARKFFDSVEPAAELNNAYAIPNENRTILLGRKLKPGLQQLWPNLKKWN